MSWRALAVAISLIGLVSVPSAAAAAAQRTGISAPSGTVTRDGLNAVSCIGVDACTAVGSTYSGPLAERWNGVSWTVQPTPRPGGLENAAFAGVSCGSATMCVAVGNGISFQNAEVVFAEHWNGSHWTADTLPVPPNGYQPSVEAVSCSSANGCTAVGRYVGHTGIITLAERWNGSRWAAQTPPNPGRINPSYYSVLSGVSCTGPSACLAVGKFTTDRYSAGDTPLTEAWNGTNWKIEPTPHPPGARSSTLASVSCTSADACTAVGTADRRVLAERWNGASWTIEPTPDPATTGPNSLAAVSCTSATACTAVGSYHSANSPTLTLAESWNGTTWRIQPTPNPAHTQSQLYGVSCPATGTCEAAGTSTTNSSSHTLAEALSKGTHWIIQPTPSP